MLGLKPFDNRDRDIFSVMDDFDRNFWGFPAERRGAYASLMRTDIRDCGDCYALEAEMPGFNKEEINLDLSGDILTVSAKHSEDKKDEKKGTYVTRERRFESVSRSFDVSGIRKEDISAEYKDGVLTLKLPKVQKQEPETRRIELK